MRSDTIKKDAIRAPHRSLLRATGVIRSEGDFRKPFIAIANSFTQIIPGHRIWMLSGPKSVGQFARREESRLNSTRLGSVTGSPWGTSA